MHFLFIHQTITSTMSIQSILHFMNAVAKIPAYYTYNLGVSFLKIEHFIDTRKVPLIGRY